MRICSLDRDTVKLISTTQIVSSVSSAVKELIENAFDADARNVEVNLTDSGLTLIEVKDDGSGISRDDAAYAGLASYTSKISSFADLESLETYGFRGEAVSALCAVADVTIVTKTKEDDAAMSYKLDRYGHIETSEICHRADGTTIQVRNLFNRVPVRRQIMANPRKASQDLKQLETLVKCYGICKFHARISYRADGNVIFAKPVMNSMNDAVAYVLGKKLISDTSWIEAESTELRIRLMVPSKGTSDPSVVLQTGAQYIFVNSRPIKNKDFEKTMCKVILEGLQQDPSTKRKPVFVLDISADASSIDVNLEPNKTAVLFKDQKTVLDTIETLLRSFYGIRLEKEKKDEELVRGEESAVSQEYSIDEAATETEQEWPACKKRKLQIDERVLEEPVLLAPSSSTRSKDSGEAQPGGSAVQEGASIEQPQGQGQRELCERFTDDVESMLRGLAPPDLSDSDSNQSQKLQPCENEPSAACTIAKGKTNDSLLFELSPKRVVEGEETLSQLPVVDLGDDFCWDEIMEGTTDKENNIETANRPEKKPNPTLDLWSKGQISGLKGGTDVRAYIPGPESEERFVDLDERSGSSGTGFAAFSKRMRSRVEEQSPGLTAPQVAYKLTGMWKELSAEERGYYRDMANEERRELEAKRKTRKEKVDSAKNKKRLLSMLEKMKELNVERKENLVMRTTVRWDLSLDKIKERLSDKSSWRKEIGMVVGSPCDNIWLVNISSHIWALDSLYLKKSFDATDPVGTEESRESVEQHLKRWLSERDDLSLLHPLHPLRSGIGQALPPGNQHLLQ